MPAWLLPAIAVGSGLLQLKGMKDQEKAAKKAHKAEQAYYEEMKKAQMWSEISDLLHGGLGVSYPIKPPVEPEKMGWEDYASALLPGIGLASMAAFPGGGGATSPQSLSEFSSGAYKSKPPKEQTSTFSRSQTGKPWWMIW